MHGSKIGIRGIRAGPGNPALYCGMSLPCQVPPAARVGIRTPPSAAGRGLALLAVLPLAALLLPLCVPAASAAVDAFGILQFHPTRAGTREWTSAHWAAGGARLVTYAGDPLDPTGWSDNHSSGGGDSLYVDGKGSLVLKGAGPRFHINSTGLYAGTPPPAKVAPQAFLDLEATGYARRLSAGGSARDGMEIQVRTGPLAHGSPGGDPCDATGYAARFRDDGNWDWEKELKHPDSKVYSTKAGFSAPLFPGKTVPIGKWIGMKFLTYNVDGGAHVRLETYIDTVSDVSNGPPADGGHWEKVGAMVDDGTDFPGGDVGGCSGLVPDMAITQGHGTLLLRTDDEACEWKFLSVREIDPATVALRFPARPEGRRPGAAGVSGFGADGLPAWLWDGLIDVNGRRRPEAAAPIAP